MVVHGGRAVSHERGIPVACYPRRARFRAKREELGGVEGLLCECPGQNPAVTVLHALSFLDSGLRFGSRFRGEVSDQTPEPLLNLSAPLSCRNYDLVGTGSLFPKVDDFLAET